MALNKRPLAFLLAVTENIAFAAGSVALGINKYMAGEEYEILVYYKSLRREDLEAFQKIPHVRLKQFSLSQDFVETMLRRIPAQSRFRDENRLMCICHFEVFQILRDYKAAVWLDVDVSVQGGIKEILEFAPFGITLDQPWLVKDNFTKPVDGYDMEAPGVCTAVMLVTDELPYEDIYSWCYRRAVDYADRLINPDQAIINLAIQEFDVRYRPMPYEDWQCVPWRDQASTARIVHFATEKKIWSTSNIFNAFPEWQRTHMQWRKLGGSDFAPGVVTLKSPVRSLDEFDAAKRNPVYLLVLGVPPLANLARKLRRALQKAVQNLKSLRAATVEKQEQ